MPYTVEHLESSRAQGFEPLDTLRAVLGSMLELDGGPVDLLDCGCGTGFFTRQYARLSGVSATGLDMDTALLSAAREIAVGEGLDIRFREGDILHLPYGDASFDRVTSDILLEIFPDPAVPVREMARVCRPGGRVLCMEPNYLSYTYYDPRLSREDNLLMARFMREGREFGAGPALPDAMARAGLEEIRLVPWFWGGHTQAPGGISREESEAAVAPWVSGLERGLAMGVIPQARAAEYRALFRRAAQAQRGPAAVVLSGLDVCLVSGKKK